MFERTSQRSALVPPVSTVVHNKALVFISAIFFKSRHPENSCKCIPHSGVDVGRTWKFTVLAKAIVQTRSVLRVHLSEWCG